MKKKQYVAPQVEVEKLRTAEIMAISDPSAFPGGPAPAPIYR